MINIALFNRNGEEILFVKEKSCGHSLISHDAIDKVRIKVRTFSTLLKELKITQVDFLKIDTKGIELEILEGSKEILLLNPQIKIVIDYAPEQETKIINYLKKLNFSPKISKDLVIIK